mmetsp:Transcript_52148/g.158439  ORF Transcript_52148/g.158439 Transcript_52148/m.158439 type:complete len:277 (+) Transcript_52148:1096-1926(+)
MGRPRALQPEPAADDGAGRLRAVPAGEEGPHDDGFGEPHVADAAGQLGGDGHFPAAGLRGRATWRCHQAPGAASAVRRRQRERDGVAASAHRAGDGRAGGAAVADQPPPVPCRDDVARQAVGEAQRQPAVWEQALEVQDSARDASARLLQDRSREKRRALLFGGGVEVLGVRLQDAVLRRGEAQVLGPGHPEVVQEPLGDHARPVQRRAGPRRRAFPTEEGTQARRPVNARALHLAPLSEVRRLHEDRLPQISQHVLGRVHLNIKRAIAKHQRDGE